MRLVTLFFFALFSLNAAAATLSPAEQRQMLNDIAAELRCPMSPNLTVLESETQIAFELKGLIGQKLAQGQEKAEIIDFLAERYGDQIRYNPKMSGQTALLWAGPALFLLLLLALLVLPAMRKRAAQR